MSTQRYRESGSMSVPSVQRRDYYKNSATLTSEVSMQVENGQTLDMTDVVTPNYQSLIARGHIINNPLLSHKVTATCAPGSRFASASAYDIANAPDGAWIGMQQDGNPSFAHGSHWIYPEVDSQAVITNASLEALNRVQGPEVMGLVDLAELRKTISFLRNPISSVTNWLKTAGRMSRDGTRRLSSTQLKALGLPSNKREEVLNAVSAVGGLELAYRYGLGPLQGSVEGVMEGLMKIPRPIRQTARGSSSKSATTSWTLDYVQNSWRGTITGTFTRDVVVRSGLLYDHHRENTWGMSLDNAPQAIWELIPYSFVIDKIVNVGDLIGAFSPRYGVRELAHYYTITTTDTIQEALSGVYNIDYVSGGRTSGGGGDSFTLVSVTKQRVPGSLRSQASLVWTPKDWFDDVYDVTTGLALIVNIAESHRRNASRL